MTAIWLGILGAAASTFLTRGAGALLGPQSLGPRALSVVALLAPALLMGLVVADVAGRRWADFDWTVVAGLLVATGFRLRFGGVVGPLLAAVVTAALLRLL
jgi:uncharacterized membrane protein